MQPQHCLPVPLLAEHDIQIAEQVRADRNIARRLFLQREGAAARAHHGKRLAVICHLDGGHPRLVVRPGHVLQVQQRELVAAQREVVVHLGCHDLGARQRHAGNARNRHTHASMRNRSTQHRHRQAARTPHAVRDRCAEQQGPLDHFRERAKDQPRRNTKGQRRQDLHPDGAVARHGQGDQTRPPGVLHDRP